MFDIFKNEGLTCIVYKDNIIYKSKDRGVKPLLELVNNNINVNGYNSIDKVIGKAAAFLYIILGVNNIYAEIISEPAYKLLLENNVNIKYEVLVPFIINRAKNGRCPMEEAVLNINDKNEALAAINKKVLELRG
ncbi:MAG: DUF1893 domain-containing protein [Acholeplasmatales bacterium]|nr:DUF1893 domain-containing protein [Acholeplasmatales bacterium]